MADTESRTPNIDLELPDNGSFENTWDVPTNANMVKIDAKFAGLEATGGHVHDGEDGQGPQIDHTDLTNIGVNAHDAIDTHIADVALHADTMISTVKGDMNGSPTTVSDVTELRFANAVVSEVSTGIALVTSLGTGGGTGASDLFYNPQSASVAYTDNFNWPTNTPLSDYCWTVLTASTIQDTWTAYNGNSTGPGVCVRARTSNLNGGTLVNGYSLAHNACHIPHCTAQRITLHVDKLRPFDYLDTLTLQRPLIPADVDAYTYVDSDDDIVLSLDLMSASVLGGTDRPTQFGISFLMQKAIGSSKIAYTLSIKPGPTQNEVLYVPTSWNDKSVRHFEGSHEFSIRRHPSISEAYYFNYYYGEGLVWSKYFAVGDGHGIAEALGDLLVTLGASDEHPDFGRIGFSAGYDVSQNTLQANYEYRIRCVSIGSQDDQSVLKTVHLPFSPSPSPDPGGGIAPLEFACPSGGVFDTLFVGDTFDFDGPTIHSTDWTIVDTIPANAVQGEGFVVKQAGSTLGNNVWCQPPVSTVPTIPTWVYSNSTNSVSTVEGTNLPRGTFYAATLQFQANSSSIPVDWQNPTSAIFYAIGDKLASGFITISNANAADNLVGANGLNVNIITYTTGDQLPYGKGLKLAGEAPYRSDFDTVWTQFVTGPAIPTNIERNVVMYDNITAPLVPTWVDVSADPTTGVIDPVVEGTTIAVGLNMQNMPLGPWFFDSTVGGYFHSATNYWTPRKTGIRSPGDNQKMVAITAGATNATVLYDRIYPKPTLNGISMVVDAPPAVVSTDSTIQTKVNLNSTKVGQSVLYFAGLKPYLWAQQIRPSPQPVYINPVRSIYTIGLNDKWTGYFLNPSVFATLNLWQADARYQIPQVVTQSLQIIPRDPVVMPGWTASTTAAGASVTLNFEVKYHHDGWLKNNAGATITNDLQVTQVTGFASGFVATITGYNPSPGLDTNTRMVTVTGVLDTAGTIVELLITKRASKAFYDNNPDRAAYGFTGQVSQKFFTTDAVSIPTFLGGSLTGYFQEDASTTITLKIKNYDVNYATAWSLNYFATPPVISVTAGPDGGGYYTWSIFGTVRDPGSNVLNTNTTTALTVANPNGNTGTYSGIPIHVTPSPNITMFSPPSWLLNSQPFQRVARLTATNVQANATVTLINDATGGLVFVQGNSLTLPISSWRVISANAVWETDVYRLGDTVDLNSVDVKVTNPSISGEDHSDTLVDAVIFHYDQIPIGAPFDPLSGQPTQPDAGEGVVTPPGQFTPGIGLLSTYREDMPDGGINGTDDIIINVQGTQSDFSTLRVNSAVFLTAPIEGFYCEYALSGRFNINSTPSPSDGLDVRFIDTTDDTLLSDPSNSKITGATRSQLVGYALLFGDVNDAFTNRPITARVTNSVTSEVTDMDTFVNVGRIVPPRIRQVSGDLVEGTIGTTVRLYGTSFIAPPPPSGAAPVDYTYSFFASGTGVITDANDVVISDNYLEYTLDIAAGKAGEVVGLYVVLNGWYIASFNNLWTVQATVAGTPAITEDILMYAPGDQALVDAGLTPDPVMAGPGNTAYVQVIGTDLSYRTIESAYLIITGEQDDAVTTRVETPPGQGLHPSYKHGIYGRINALSIISQSDTKVVFEFPATPELANARVKLYIVRPASHPLGAGSWNPATIDSTGSGTAMHVTNIGLTARYGSSARAPNLNHDVDVHVRTQLQWARAVQRIANSPSPGVPFDITVRFESAITGSILPTIISLPDPDYGSEFTVTNLSLASNKLDLTLTLAGPRPGIDDTYPYATYQPAQGSPDVSPPKKTAACGLGLANGQSIFSVVLGRKTWGKTTGQLSFSP